MDFSDLDLIDPEVERALTQAIRTAIAALRELRRNLSEGGEGG